MSTNIDMIEVQISAGAATLDGNLTIVRQAKALVLFAHGSGSSRHSPRNQFVARTLNDAGLATLLFDLLTPEEESVDLYTREHRFDINLLAKRLVHATNWAKQQSQTQDFNIGYFGSSTGAGAALMAAAEMGEVISSVISRGGRPDLAGNALPRVLAPTLLIVGGNDGHDQRHRHGLQDRRADRACHGHDSGAQARGDERRPGPLLRHQSAGR